jgi:hypothetical protein
MAQIRLYNQSGRLITAGSLVRIDPKNVNAIVSAALTEYGVIGTASTNINNGSWGFVNLINTPNWNDVIGKPVIPDGVDVSDKVDKVEGSSLVSDTEIAKIHAAHSDDQVLSNYADKNFVIAMAISL